MTWATYHPVVPPERTVGGAPRVLPFHSPRGGGAGGGMPLPRTAAPREPRRRPDCLRRPPRPQQGSPAQTTPWWTGQAHRALKDTTPREAPPQGPLPRGPTQGAHGGGLGPVSGTRASRACRWVRRPGSKPRPQRQKRTEGPWLPGGPSELRNLSLKVTANSRAAGLPGTPFSGPTTRAPHPRLLPRWSGLQDSMPLGGRVPQGQGTEVRPHPGLRRGGGGTRLRPGARVGAAGRAGPARAVPGALTRHDEGVVDAEAAEAVGGLAHVGPRVLPLHLLHPQPLGQHPEPAPAAVDGAAVLSPHGQRRRVPLHGALQPDGAAQPGHLPRDHLVRHPRGACRRVRASSGWRWGGRCWEPGWGCP